MEGPQDTSHNEFLLPVVFQKILGRWRERIKEAVVIIAFPVSLVICELIFPGFWVTELLRQLICNGKT